MALKGRNCITKWLTHFCHLILYIVIMPNPKEINNQVYCLSILPIIGTYSPKSYNIGLFQSQAAQKHCVMWDFHQKFREISKSSTSMCLATKGTGNFRLLCARPKSFREKKAHVMLVISSVKS